MVSRLIVSNTGPLISLEKIDEGYSFIRKLYDKIFIPSTVLQEVSYHLSSPQEYLDKYKINDLIEVHSVDQILSDKIIDRLHQGEKEAISLAVQKKLPILIEDADARAYVQKKDIKFSGIAGQVMKAWDKKLIAEDEAKDKLNQLLKYFRINHKIYQDLTAIIKSRGH